MSPLSAELADKLAVLASALPEVVISFLDGELGPTPQRRLADQLADLADVLNDHADDQERGIIELSAIRASAGRLSKLAKRRGCGKLRSAAR
ncbi:hypothetical protein ABZU76_34015 [Amycolatopsis sp. NPDC005232]|uniref:hypothetical protein n=1 Tax=Amycolatopsis sp. NPDC005232 TaxID=3157027 RepID=UPI0033B13EEF